MARLEIYLEWRGTRESYPRMSGNWREFSGAHLPLLAGCRPTLVAGHRPGGIDPLRSVVNGSLEAPKNARHSSRPYTTPCNLSNASTSASLGAHSAPRRSARVASPRSSSGSLASNTRSNFSARRNGSLWPDTTMRDTRKPRLTSSARAGASVLPAAAM